MIEKSKIIKIQNLIKIKKYYKNSNFLFYPKNLNKIKFILFLEVNSKQRILLFI